MSSRDQKMFNLGEGMPVDYLREKALQAPDTAEIIGLCKGVVADKRVNQREAEALLKWVKKNQTSAGKWPCNIIFKHISRVLSDGLLDLDEQQEMLVFLSRICGEGDFDGKVQLVQNIPYDKVEHLPITGNAFCLTGEFATGTRPCCHRLLQQCGGIVKKSPVKHSVLVVGSIASKDWKFNEYGNKIKKAIEYREKGFGVTIVSEDVFVSALEDYNNEH